MKVLNIHWGFGVGGVSTYCALLQGIVDFQPIENRSICIITDGAHCDDKGLKTLNADTIPLSGRFDLSWVRALVAVAHNECPDVVMTHGFNGYFAEWVVGWFTNRPSRIVSSFHGFYYPATPLRKVLAPVINRFIRWYLASRVDAVVSVSEFSKAKLVASGIPAEKVTVIHNGIDSTVATGAVRDTVRERLRSEWSVSAEEVLVGVACRFDEIKGLSYLLEAFRDLAQACPQLKLVMIGSGPMEAKLKQFVINEKLSDKVVFTGFRSDIASCLEAIDIYALPSLIENHSIALLEAMRASKAIIASDAGGNTESVRHEEEALVVPVSDSEAIKAVLLRLLNETGLCRRLGAAAQARFKERFTQEAMSKRTADWLVNIGSDKR